ncbi:P-loop NTPase family protein [Flammeovirga agarivorans]|uniref:Protein RecA n=1 Tax=Flammeovirga agarivorans TaxID=2726742 RepID=A0A7X8SRC3_9BACT|nr:hypothetical protein [Flammeovirga agarivorans]NLR94926.1 hypothetical protein [Flammeovirga agarivorans]
MSELNELIGELAERYGGSTIIRPATETPKVEFIPTMIPTVDKILGGGVAINRITELYGDFSSGKSWLTYNIISQFQRFDWKNRIPNGIRKIDFEKKLIKGKGRRKDRTVYDIKKIHSEVEDAETKVVVLIDFEKSYSKEWGEKQGIWNEHLIHIVPSSPDEAIDITETFLSSNSVGLVCFDSIHAVGGVNEVNESMEKNTVGESARLWNRGFRKFQAALNRNEGDDTTLIFINSAYTEMGMFGGEKVKGGKGAAFAKSVSLRMQGLAPEKSKEEVLGKEISIHNKKNKVAKPHLSGRIFLSLSDNARVPFGTCDRTMQIIEIAAEEGIVQQSGAFFQYDGQKKCQGKLKFADWLESSGELEKIVADVYEALGITL